MFTNSLRSSFVALALCAAALSAPAARAEWGPGQRMAEASGRLVGVAKALTDNNARLGFDSDICLLGGFVKPGKDVRFERTLMAGKKYAIVGGGDDMADDIDITITDASGKVVAQDTDSDATPVTVFTPARTGRYTIATKLYRASRGSFVSLVILRDGGYDVPVDNLASALGGCLQIGERADAQIEKTLYFNDVENQWALFGSILERGDDLTINNIRTISGEHAFIAASDTTAQDTDLFLLSSGGATVAKDDDDHKNSLFVARTLSGSNYGFRMKNVRSSGPSLVVAAILRPN